MKNKLKMLSIALVLVICFSVMYSFVFADVPYSFPSQNGSITRVDDGVKKVWGTVVTVVQILAFAAVVFAGLRYMFASADQKADIKKGLGMLTIGAILVFAASTVVSFVVNAANDVI